MAGRGQVSWLPGWSAAPSRDSVSSQWLTRCACGFLDPVTVAGPRRSCTGLPLTTDRIYSGESNRPALGKAARYRPGALKTPGDSLSALTSSDQQLVRPFAR
jgi:hypothetical protein